MMHRLVVAGLVCVALWTSPSLAASPEQHRTNTAPDRLVLSTPERRPAPAEMKPVTRAVGTVTLRRTFLDEFSSFTPNAPPWRHHYDHGPYDKLWARTLTSNDEQQIYVDPGFAGTGSRALRLNPFSVKDGILQITGRAAPTTTRPQLDGYEYVSGV